MTSSEILRRVVLVRTEVSEECIASIVRVIRICELGETLAVTSISLQRASVLVTANVVPSADCYGTLLMEAIVRLKRRFLQEPHGVTSKKTPFFIITAVKTSNLT
jgi:hypothetical protein